LAHGLIVSEAGPFSVHGDLAAVGAAMKGRRNEPGRFADDLAGDLGQYIDQSLLIGRIDLEDIDEDNHGVAAWAKSESIIREVGSMDAEATAATHPSETFGLPAFGDGR